MIADAGMVRGERFGVDASTMEANAALRAIVRRDTSEGYREMLQRMAEESGIETPTAADPIRPDRKRTGKKLSNEDWFPRPTAMPTKPIYPAVLGLDLWEIPAYVSLGLR